MATWTDDPDYSDNWSYSDSGGCSGASYGDSAGWDDWGGHYSDARYSDYSDYSDSYSDYSDSIQSSSDTKQSSDTIPVNVHGKIINMTTEQYAKYQGALSRGKSISEALTYAGVYTSDNTVPVNVNGQTVYMTIEDYARYEGTLSRAKNPKVSIQDGKIVIQDVQTQKMPQQTQQSQQNTIKLDDYFRLNTTPSSPKEPLTAPIVEISNAPGLEPYYGSGLINPNDTVAEALTRHPTVQELNTANTFENIVSAPKLSTFNPTNITVNPDIVSNVKYTNIDPFSSPAMSNVERNRNAVENRINKQVNNYMNLPGRRAITQAETSIVEGLGNIGKTVAGTPGEVVGKAAGYFVAGAGELTVGTTYAAVTSVMTGKNYLTAQGELLLKGGKETVKSIAKTAITPVAPAIEGLTGIKTPRATTDDVAMTLATVAPVGLARVGRTIKTGKFDVNIPGRALEFDIRNSKITLLEDYTSQTGFRTRVREYTINPEKNIPIKKITDIEYKFEKIANGDTWGHKTEIVDRIDNARYSEIGLQSYEKYTGKATLEIPGRTLQLKKTYKDGTFMREVSEGKDLSYGIAENYDIFGQKKQSIGFMHNGNKIGMTRSFGNIEVKDYSGKALDILEKTTLEDTLFREGNRVSRKQTLDLDGFYRVSWVVQENNVINAYQRIVTNNEVSELALIYDGNKQTKPLLPAGETISRNPQDININFLSPDSNLGKPRDATFFRKSRDLGKDIAHLSLGNLEIIKKERKVFSPFLEYPIEKEVKFIDLTKPKSDYYLGKGKGPQTPWDFSEKSKSIFRWDKLAEILAEHPEIVEKLEIKEEGVSKFYIGEERGKTASSSAVVTNGRGLGKLLSEVEKAEANVKTDTIDIVKPRDLKTADIVRKLKEAEELIHNKIKTRNSQAREVTNIGGAKRKTSPTLIPKISKKPANNIGGAINSKPANLLKPAPSEYVKPAIFNIVKPKPAEIVKPKPAEIVKPKPVEIVRPKPVEITRPKTISTPATPPSPPKIPPITPPSPSIIQLLEIKPDVKIPSFGRGQGGKSSGTKRGKWAKLVTWF